MPRGYANANRKRSQHEPYVEVRFRDRRDCAELTSKRSAARSARWWRIPPSRQSFPRLATIIPSAYSMRMIAASALSRVHNPCRCISSRRLRPLKPSSRRTAVMFTKATSFWLATPIMAAATCRTGRWLNRSLLTRRPALLYLRPRPRQRRWRLRARRLQYARAGDLAGRLSGATRTAARAR